MREFDVTEKVLRKKMLDKQHKNSEFFSLPAEEHRADDDDLRGKEMETSF